MNTETQSAEKLVVGMTLLYVPNDLRRGEPREVTVTKVGRKWADTSIRLRISVTTLEVQFAEKRPAELVGGCNCYDRPPTVPVFRDWNTHLTDCPAHGTNIPVGAGVRRRA